MSARRSKEVLRHRDEYRDAVSQPRPRKKIRASRVRLTHFEVRRGEALRLRIAVADDAIADVGDELGALIRRIAPGASGAINDHTSHAIEQHFEFSQTHGEHDAAYHDELRERLVDLFSALCDTGLEQALDVARQERARRAEGSN